MVFVFDLGGVLSDIDVIGFIARMQNLMPEGEVWEADQNALLAGGGDSFLHQYELGEITSEQTLKCFHDMCRPEVTNEQIQQVWLSELALVQESIKALLRRLRQNKHTVFLLSNTNEMHWNYIADMFNYDGYTLQDHFDKLFLSYELHLHKPEKPIFDEVSKYIPHGEEVIYIDDAERNRIAGEKYAGWRTFESIEQLMLTLNI